ncbi:response regulator [Rhodoblastus acidophilus]|uniref:Response regulator n=1 Tax=Candidatus Rhodoblastus alkanivorans TaxID=2954117 RepID=A0ABS9Z2F3_9HYPH|nr:response regulator [Candidatus Rhodoblastus alkanivorans]MCI4677495.1 response regulator [Candidatus Rhodoblastus alkanivorans]MCI4681854.1 response regulator [Candidatus Rhodoblastus alkanivorans]MDI4642904.1 response regulator [Rhodoblastus acidophilus]
MDQGNRTSDNLVVHIVDDDDDVRESLSILLRAENFETKTYRSAEDFLTATDSGVHGCVVTDVRMPGMDGIDLIARLRERGSALPVVVITGHGNVKLAVRAMKLGALDFIEKPYSACALIGAIRNVCANAPEPAEFVSTRENFARLTPREKEVLLKMIEGLPNKIIAYDLRLSVRTVESHRAAVMKKMAGGSLAELVGKCMAVGLVPPERPMR